MAIVDPNLPTVSRGPIEEIEINIKGYRAKTKQKWSGDDCFYSIQVELEFEKCVKKFLGICTKKEKYKKWVEVPYNIYSPNLYPEFWPINIVYCDELDREYELSLPDIRTEREWTKFVARVEAKHGKILR